MASWRGCVKSKWRFRNKCNKRGTEGGSPNCNMILLTSGGGNLSYSIHVDIHSIYVFIPNYDVFQSLLFNCTSMNFLILIGKFPYQKSFEITSVQCLTLYIKLWMRHLKVESLLEQLLLPIYPTFDTVHRITFKERF